MTKEWILRLLLTLGRNYFYISLLKRLHQRINRGIQKSGFLLLENISFTCTAVLDLDDEYI